MPRRHKETSPQRPNYYETSSPFETYVSGRGKAGPGGLVDPVKMDNRLSGFASVADTIGQMHPAQYDNPRGFPGLSMTHTGDGKSKFPLKDQTMHDITNAMEGSADLVGTGKSGK